MIIHIINYIVVNFIFSLSFFTIYCGSVGFFNLKKQKGKSFEIWGTKNVAEHFLLPNLCLDVFLCFFR